MSYIYNRAESRTDFSNNLTDISSRKALNYGRVD